MCELSYWGLFKTASNTTLKKTKKILITEKETIQRFEIECYIKTISATNAFVNEHFSQRSGLLDAV
jgi:hypothetical protein